MCGSGLALGAGGIGLPGDQFKESPLEPQNVTIGGETVWTEAI